MSEDKPIKAVLIGEECVGKTSLFYKILESEFNQEYNPTLVSDYCQRAICVDNKDHLFKLFDTPGQERFRSLNRIFINSSKIIIIVFEIDKKESFNQVDFWYNFTKEILGDDGYIIALVGNKADLYNQQEVSDEEIEKKAKELKAKFTITSAKEYDGFKKFFDDLLKDYINKYHPEECKECYTSTTKEIKFQKEQAKKRKKMFKEICIVC